MKRIIIALDGYAGTGKSSTAKQVATRLGYTHIDSGAMYRAITHHFIQNQINYNDPQAVEKSLQSCDICFKKEGIYLNNQNVETKIRTMEVSKYVSTVSTIHRVRANLVARQRKIGRRKGIIMDGRDIGTVVFPDAELKIFMTAQVEIRTARKKKQLEEEKIIESADSVRENLIDRDNTDSMRKDSPLKRVENAIEIDTSHLTLKQQVDKIVALANRIIYEN